jgi:SprT-like family
MKVPSLAYFQKLFFIEFHKERLRHTLAHEACHAASWAISGDFKQPHGATFKSWSVEPFPCFAPLTFPRGKKVMSAFPGVEVSTKHDYEIAYKFSWRCLAPSCGHLQV